MGTRHVPRINGPFWTIAHNPDLGSLRDAGEPAPQETVDLGVWRARDGTIQMWSCIRNVTYASGPEQRLFAHWQANAFTDVDWTPLGVAMEADPAVGELALQAPFVFQAADGFHMYYGDWTAICEQSSDEGKTFSRRLGTNGQCALFAEGAAASNTRDPMLLAVGGTYYLYYSANPEGVGGDYVRTSSDLRSWSDSRLVARGGRAGMGPFAAECPFVVLDEGTGDYFLFRTQNYKPGIPMTSVYRSKDLLNFGIDDDRFFVGTLPVAAPEIVHDGADWFIVTPTPALDGYQAARLEWVVGDAISP